MFASRSSPLLRILIPVHALVRVRFTQLCVRHPASKSRYEERQTRGDRTCANLQPPHIPSFIFFVSLFTPFRFISFVLPFSRRRLFYAVAPFLFPARHPTRLDLVGWLRLLRESVARSQGRRLARCASWQLGMPDPSQPLAYWGSPPVDHDRLRYAGVRP